MSEEKGIESFGELGTDEPGSSERAPLKRQDLDRVMLTGCVLFSAASALQLLVIFAAYALAPDLKTYDDLYRIMAYAVPAAGLLGLAFTWFGSIPGFCGSAAGLIPAALFMWLRLADAVSGFQGIRGYEPAEFPAVYSWTVPLLYCLTFGLLWYGLLWLRLRQQESRARREGFPPSP
ncbi:MAG: hypothetical protein IH851_06535 [Armatimonadetes bacterium]|nr:hypothetical protein [Armatimonadota bacterium]